MWARRKLGNNCWNSDIRSPIHMLVFSDLYTYGYAYAAFKCFNWPMSSRVDILVFRENKNQTTDDIGDKAWLINIVITSI